MDFSNTKISLKRSIWSYGKVERVIRFLSGRQAHFYGIPNLRWGGVRKISKKRGRLRCHYVSFHNVGLYSNLSTTLEDVITLRNEGIEVKRINYSFGMNYFKNQPGKDVYPEFFDVTRLDSSRVPRGMSFDAFDVHKVYKTLPLADLQKAAFNLFYPSACVFEIANEIVRSSGIVPEQAIAIMYRGTDKASEVQLAPIDDYIRLADSIMRQSDGELFVIIQTDQEQIRRRMTEHFGEKCRYFDVLPVTRDDVVIHQLDFGGDIKIGREEFAQRMIAAVVTLSRCAHLITYTGNVGAWSAIYRGSSKNLYQFDADAQLRRP